MNAKTAAFFAVAILLLTACQAEAAPAATYDPSSLRFSGERSLDLETQFVTQFPNRQSGQPNNHLAAQWLSQQFTGLGWDCTIDNWQVTNYSQPVPLNNVVCHLPGASEKEILVTAHLD